MPLPEHSLIRGAFMGLLFLFSASEVTAADGRLLSTGGATQVEGAGGGGIVPWAILSSLATEDEFGATAFYTFVPTGDLTLHAIGASVNIRNRVEFSAARQQLHLGTLALLLKVPGEKLEQNILGVKVRIAGDAVYSAIPQISIGAQYKQLETFSIPKTIGAIDDSGVDGYIAATKVLLGVLAGRNVLVNGTLRATRANQLGLLGFGGDLNDEYEILPEISASVFLSPEVTVGAEYRAKPDNLSFSRESAWSDVFIGYFPNKNLAVIAAYASLGTVASLPKQSGFFLSLQATF